MAIILRAPGAGSWCAEAALWLGSTGEREESEVGAPPIHPQRRVSQFGCMDAASVQLFPQDDELTISSSTPTLLAEGATHLLLNCEMKP